MTARKPTQFLDQTATRLRTFEAEIALIDSKLVEQDIAARRIEADAGWVFAQAHDKIEAALKACGVKLNAEEWCKKIISRDISTMRRRIRLHRHWKEYESKRREMGQCGQSGLLFALSLVMQHLPVPERAGKPMPVQSPTGTKVAESSSAEPAIPNFRPITGDALIELPKLAARSVNTIVSSPPYWPRKRQYGSFSKIGCESTVEEYISNVVAVLRECRRVLRDDGILWLNIDDCYVDGDLQYIPERLGMALREDGWITRAKVIWHKIAYHPESVTNRPTKDYETVLLLTKKRSHYCYDADPLRVPGKIPPGGNNAIGGHRKREKFRNDNDRIDRYWANPMGRNLGMVWQIRPSSEYRGDHPATMPLELAERCVLLGCPETGVVLDPFGGAGTTALAALRLGRRAISIEINPQYTNEAQQRIATELGRSTPNKLAAD